MDPRDNGKRNLTIRPGRAKTTESNTTQNTQSSSNNESGLSSNSHDHVLDGHASGPATGPQTQIAGVLNVSIRTTDATGGPRRPSDSPSNSDSIELREDPDHPHACDVEKDIQKLAKPFDRNNEKLNKK